MGGLTVVSVVDRVLPWRRPIIVLARDQQSAVARLKAMAESY